MDDQTRTRQAGSINTGISQETPSEKTPVEGGQKTPVKRRPAADGQKTPVKKRPAADGQKTPVKKRPAADGQKTPVKKRPAADGQGTPVKKRAAADGQGTPVKKRPAAGGQGTPVKKRPAADGQGNSVKKLPAADAQETPAWKHTESSDGKMRVRKRAAESLGQSGTDNRRTAATGSASGDARPATGTTGSASGDARPRPATGTGSSVSGDAKPAKGTGRPAAQQTSYSAKKKRKKAPALILTFLLIVIIGGVFVYLTFGKNYTPKVAAVDLNAFYGMESDEDMLLVIDNMMPEVRGRLVDGVPYVDYDTVRTVLDPRVYVDTGEELLLYSLPDQTIELPLDADTCKIDGEEKKFDHKVLINADGTYYVAMPFVEEHANLTAELFDNPNRLVLHVSEEPVNIAKVTRGCELTAGPDHKSENLVNLMPDDVLTVLEEGEEYTKAATQDGIIGYVKNKRLGNVRQQDMSRDYTAPVYSSLTRDHTIHMGWHQVQSQSSNDWFSETIEKTKNLNVIAPTWFFLPDTSGALSSIADPAYVESAHAKDIEVWATLNDFDGQELFGGPNSMEETLELLSSTSARRKLEKQLIDELLACKADGLNVDFEKVGEDCGPHYIQFIRELSILCRANDLVLSVDSYVPSAWTTQYHRDEVGEIADYVVIMCYDEFGSWSEEIGPNASFGYTEQAVLDITQDVSPEKVLIGLPFYTRLWEQKPMTSGNGTETNCYTKDINELDALIGEAGADVTWDDMQGENFATWESGGATYKIWLEDETSISNKLKCMKDHGIAGYACWKLTQETEDIWDVLKEY